MSDTNRLARRTATAVAFIALIPTGSAHADDSLDHVRVLMKEHTQIQAAVAAPTAPQWVLPRLVTAAHAKAVDSTLTDLRRR